MEDLIQLLPDGASAVAVIIVVMLFLRQQDRINLMLETITKGFSEQVNDSQRAFLEQVLQLTSRQFDNQRLYQDQIQSLGLSGRSLRNPIEHARQLFEQCFRLLKLLERFKNLHPCLWYGNSQRIHQRPA